jgi:hypothetical protein
MKFHPYMPAPSRPDLYHLIRRRAAGRLRVKLAT